MVDKEIYVMTFIVGTSIFILGFYIGGLINQGKINAIMDQNELLSIRIENINLAMKMLESMNNTKITCDYMNEQLKESTKERMKIVEDLQRTEKLDTKKFDITKRKYTLSLINIWLLSRERDRICGTRTPIILYFYAIGDEKSREQGKILDHIVYTYDHEGKNLMVLSIDKNFDMPIINIFEKDLNVTFAPTIIINGKKFDGLAKEDIIENYLCNEFDYCLAQ